MRLEHHLVGGYVRYISPHIIIIIKNKRKLKKWRCMGLRQRARETETGYFWGGGGPYMITKLNVL